MATLLGTSDARRRLARLTNALDEVARCAVPVGRVLFASIFIMSSFGHFSAGTIQFAAAKGVPFPQFLVPFSGILSLAGGLSIALGWHARIGASLIVAFLVPVTFMMHDYWTVSDPAAAKIEQIMFMKNVAMLGGAVLMTWFGAGPLSLDERGARVEI
ncbi:MAG: DoxX family protein [Planctomycetes bacterium]|nr:DoxX family protein [Planctomycetota bacterium]